MSGRPDCRVYSGPVLAVATHLKHVLDMNGIECEVRGEYLAAGVGEIPVIEAWPELWVLDKANGENAARLVREALEEGESEQASWECQNCQEVVEGQFAVCWNCGALGKSV